MKFTYNGFQKLTILKINKMHTPKQLNKIPFDSLRIAYYRVFDMSHNKVFLDATDEQILNLLVKEYHETVVIQRIENVGVMEITTTFPNKNKLHPSELKSGITIEEKEIRAEKIKKLREKYN